MVELAAKALCRFEGAAGDIWYGSVKRVASAVGERAMAVQFVEEYLKEM
jgi:thioredoxin reductase (NADPH)